MAGIPKCAASKVAPNVPLVVMDLDRFSPILIPDITKSGSSSINPLLPNITQSVGVPVTA